jgi:tripartite-type tricarboxylate transporter receptor subunit TctC
MAEAMYANLPYDIVNDFAFIGMLTDYPFILVTYPDHRIRTVAELIAAAKTAADPLVYGTAGHGSGQHLSGVLLASMAGISLQHRAFAGGAVSTTELLGKRLDFLFDTPALHLELIRGGFVRPLAVTGRERFFALPDVPTIAETVSGYDTSSWLGSPARARCRPISSRA